MDAAQNLLFELDAMRESGSLPPLQPCLSHSALAGSRGHLALGKRAGETKSRRSHVVVCYIWQSGFSLHCLWFWRGTTSPFAIHGVVNFSIDFRFPRLTRPLICARETREAQLHV